MTMRLVVAAALFCAVGAVFFTASEVARVCGRRRVTRAFAPGRDLGEVHRLAAPLFRLSRELAAVATLLFATAAGVVVSLTLGAP